MMRAFKLASPAVYSMPHFICHSGAGPADRRGMTAESGA
jgi:hypothetical protein